MSKYVMVIDQEATAISVRIYNKHLQIVQTDYANLVEHTNNNGRIQYDPMEIYEQVVKVCKRVFSSGISPQDILTIGITNESRACIAWDKNTGISYTMIPESGGISTYIENTFSWYLENVTQVREAMNQGTALVGTMDTWLIWNLTGRTEHIISSSNASSMECFLMDEKSWNYSTLDSLQIPFNILPEVQSDAGELGTTCEELFGREIPITAAIAHQTSMVFALECRLQGTAVISLRDTCIYIHKGDEIGNVGQKWNPTIAWQIGEDTTYAIQVGGASIQPIVKFMNESEIDVTKYQKINAQEQAMEGSPRVMVIPQPNEVGGLKGASNIGYTIFGATNQIVRAQIEWASLEAVVYQIKDILDKIEKNTGIELTELVVHGQFPRNGYLLQKLANLIGTTIKCPRLMNYAALGAAELSGLQIGLWDYMDITDVLVVTESYEPKGDIQQEETYYTQWCLAKHCVEQLVRLSAE